MLWQGGGDELDTDTDSQEVTDVFDTILHSDDLIFVGGNVSEMCGGNVGANGDKWCVMDKEECVCIEPKSHCKKNPFKVELGLPSAK